MTTSFPFHHAPSNASPFFNSSEFEKIRATTSEAIFRQEWRSFRIRLQYSATFGNARQGVLEPPRAGALYLIGADIAKHVDWTVLTVWDVERRHLVAFERFNQIDWPLIEGRIASLAAKYNRARYGLTRPASVTRFTTASTGPG